MYVEKQIESFPLGPGTCSECKNGYLFRQEPYVEESKDTEFGLPKQFRVFRCSNCPKVLGLYKGMFEVLSD
jgi:hypothetical protein